VATIDDFPLAGRSRDEIRAGLRSLAASPDVVFYRLKDDRPEIVRVLDGRRDIEEIFSED
jgi:toxin ParE1/3/4